MARRALCSGVEIKTRFASQLIDAYSAIFPPPPSDFYVYIIRKIKRNIFFFVRKFYSIAELYGCRSRCGLCSPFISQIYVYAYFEFLLYLNGSFDCCHLSIYVVDRVGN